MTRKQNISFAAFMISVFREVSSTLTSYEENDQWTANPVDGDEAHSIPIKFDCRVTTQLSGGEQAELAFALPVYFNKFK